MTVADVLAEAGIAAGFGGYIPCLFHDEKTASFSYRDALWHCFGCGEGGNAEMLARRLGLVAEIEGIEGFLPAPCRPKPRASEVMEAMLEADRQWAIGVADELHREGLAGVALAESLWPMLGEAVLEDYGEGWDMVARAHTWLRRLKAEACCADP